MNNKVKKIQGKVKAAIIWFAVCAAGIIIGGIIHSAVMNDVTWFILSVFIFLLLFSFYVAICIFQFMERFWILFSVGIIFLVAALVGIIIHAVFVQGITGETIAIIAAPLLPLGVILSIGDEKAKKKKKKPKIFEE